MSDPGSIHRLTRERERIVREHGRRERELDAEMYAPWRLATAFFHAGRLRMSAELLTKCSGFPKEGDRCLEIGHGRLGWLADLLSWGVREQDLSGIEIDSQRAEKARDVFPAADLRVGDAAEMPWESATFQLVVVSTVFSSILDAAVRRLVSREIVRVLAPGGALLWYDFFVNNPKNPNVRAIGRVELKSLFPDLNGVVRSMTLAPPLARWLVPKSWVLATALETVPFLRTHLMGVLRKETR